MAFFVEIYDGCLFYRHDNGRELTYYSVTEPSSVERRLTGAWHGWLLWSNWWPFFSLNYLATNFLVIVNRLKFLETQDKPFNRNPKTCTILNFQYVGHAFTAHNLTHSKPAYNEHSQKIGWINMNVESQTLQFWKKEVSDFIVERRNNIQSGFKSAYEVKRIAHEGNYKKLKYLEH